MPSIPAATPLGFIGVILLIAGFVLLLAGFEIINIKTYVNVVPGRKTWAAGLLLAVVGIVFLLPDILVSSCPKRGSS
jgi:hypothetical protein